MFLFSKNLVVGVEGLCFNVVASMISQTVGPPLSLKHNWTLTLAVLSVAHIPIHSAAENALAPLVAALQLLALIITIVYQLLRTEL